MSTPYTSTTLSDMAQKTCDMVQRERKTLSNAKVLLTKLRGDETWVTPGRMETSYDDAIFETRSIYEMILANAPVASSRHSNRSTLNGKINEDISPPKEDPAMGVNGSMHETAIDQDRSTADHDIPQPVISNASDTINPPREEDQVDDIQLINGTNVSPERKADLMDGDIEMNQRD